MPRIEVDFGNSGLRYFEEGSFSVLRVNYVDDKDENSVVTNVTSQVQYFSLDPYHIDIGVRPVDVITNESEYQDVDDQNNVQVAIDGLVLKFLHEGAGRVRIIFVDQKQQQFIYENEFVIYKPFFRDNYLKSILPQFEADKIAAHSRMKPIMDSLMEFLDIIYAYRKNIDYLKNTDKLRSDFLDLLGVSLGFQRVDFQNEDVLLQIISTKTYREILKNLTDLLRIRGTKLSYELFFSILGYDIDLDEFWYDHDGNLIEINSADDGTGPEKYRSTFYRYNTNGVALDNPQIPGVDPRAKPEDPTLLKNTKSNFIKANLTPSILKFGTTEPSAFTIARRRIINYYLEFLRPIHVTYLQEVFKTNLDEDFIDFLIDDMVSGMHDVASVGILNAFPPNNTISGTLLYFDTNSFTSTYPYTSNINVKLVFDQPVFSVSSTATSLLNTGDTITYETYPLWASGTGYLQDQKIVNNNKIYKAIQNFTSSGTISYDIANNKLINITNTPEAKEINATYNVPSGIYSSRLNVNDLNITGNIQTAPNGNNVIIPSFVSIPNLVNLSAILEVDSIFPDFSINFITQNDLDIIYTKPVNAPALSSGSYSISGIIVSGVTKINNYAYRLHTSTQNYLQTYTLDISSSVKDSPGNPLAVYSKSYTTPDDLIITVPPDIIPNLSGAIPNITGVIVLDSNNIQAIFDIPLAISGAENLSNYSISNSVIVSGAVIQPGLKTVNLAVSSLSGIQYTLTVSGQENYFYPSVKIVTPQDILFDGIAFVDTTAPRLTGVNVLDYSNIVANFNEPININSATFTISGVSGAVTINSYTLSLDKTQITFSTSGMIQDALYVLKCFTTYDLSGNLIDPLFDSFIFFGKGLTGDENQTFDSVSGINITNDLINVFFNNIESEIEQIEIVLKQRFIDVITYPLKWDSPQADWDIDELKWDQNVTLLDSVEIIKL